METWPFWLFRWQKQFCFCVGFKGFSERVSSVLWCIIVLWQLYYFYYAKPYILFLLLALETVFLKLKDKETKGEPGMVIFPTAESLICTFFICKSYAHFHMYIFSKSYYKHFCIYPCLVFLSILLVVCYFIPLCAVSKEIMSILLCIYLLLFFILTIHLHWEISLWHHINVTIIITMLVKLLRMIWGYVTSFVVSFSRSLFLYR